MDTQNLKWLISCLLGEGHPENHPDFECIFESSSPRDAYWAECWLFLLCQLLSRLDGEIFAQAHAAVSQLEFLLLWPARWTRFCNLDFQYHSIKLQVKILNAAIFRKLYLHAEEFVSTTTSRFISEFSRLPTLVSDSRSLYFACSLIGWPSIWQVFTKSHSKANSPMICSAANWCRTSLPSALCKYWQLL